MEQTINIEELIQDDHNFNKGTEAGHVLTKEEGIAMNLVNQALQGDIKAVEYCQRAKLICAQNQSKNKKK